jgi:hypothetical protein
MKIFDFLKKKSRQVDQMAERLRQLESAVDHMRQALGRIEARQSAAIESADLGDHEFKVFSQWGEDGIIDYLTRLVRIPRTFFVEFGVEDYREANTRFLLTHRGWEGLVMDGDPRQITTIQRDPIYWQNRLKAAQAFVTRENINALLQVAFDRRGWKRLLDLGSSHRVQPGDRDLRI